ncbi:MAG: hypothetical protein COB54_03540 [Alphaproteobacteria bacterium]|nr:MAG: hypothetical protein COB54_03540 [Alphaproteobacteria bacterium]
MTSLNLTQTIIGYEEKLARLIEQMAEQIVIGARARVYRGLKNPKGSSPLAQSLRAEKLPEGGMRIITDKPYARYVEFGTIRQPARPFLTPATEEVKVTFSGLI